MLGRYDLLLLDLTLYVMSFLRFYVSEADLRFVRSSKLFFVHKSGDARSESNHSFNDFRESMSGSAI